MTPGSIAAALAILATVIAPATLSLGDSHDGGWVLLEVTHPGTRVWVNLTADLHGPTIFTQQSRGPSATGGGLLILGHDSAVGIGADGSAVVLRAPGLSETRRFPTQLPSTPGTYNTLAFVAGHVAEWSWKLEGEGATYKVLKSGGKEDVLFLHGHEVDGGASARATALGGGLSQTRGASHSFTIDSQFFGIAGWDAVGSRATDAASTEEVWLTTPDRAPMKCLCGTTHNPTGPGEYLLEWDGRRPHEPLNERVLLAGVDASLT